MPELTHRERGGRGRTLRPVDRFPGRRLHATRFVAAAAAFRATEHRVGVPAPFGSVRIAFARGRGGSVASHMRISKEVQYGPLTPDGCADILLGLEPVESLRILTRFGNPNTIVITNTRPIYTMAVAIGDAEYPGPKSIEVSIAHLSKMALYIDASKIAINMGRPLLTNIIMAGALVSTGLLPVNRDMLEHQLRMNFRKELLALNLKAFAAGIDEIKSQIVERVVTGYTLPQSEIVNVEAVLGNSSSRRL